VEEDFSTLVLVLETRGLVVLVAGAQEVVVAVLELLAVLGSRIPVVEEEVQVEGLMLPVGLVVPGS
jgi:hypothetical protein